MERVRGVRSGVRLQATIDPAERLLLPVAMQMTTVAANDAATLGRLDLSGLGGKTLVFDLGYYSHANFERLRRGGVRFLTRLKAQEAHYRVSGVRPVAEEPPEKTTSSWAAPTTGAGRSWKECGWSRGGTPRGRYTAS